MRMYVCSDNTKGVEVQICCCKKADATGEQQVWHRIGYFTQIYKVNAKIVYYIFRLGNQIYKLNL